MQIQSNIARRAGLQTWLLLVGCVLSSPWAGSCSADDLPLTAHSGELVNIASPRSNVEIAERFAKTLHFPAAIKRVDGFDQSVISITPLSPSEIRVQAVEQGVTTIVFTDENSKAYHVEVFVTGDARLLQSVLKRTYPTTAVSVIKVRDSVLLRGWVSEPQQINEIVALAELYYPRVLNQMRVGGPQEVQLRVKVMEVQRSLARQFGINFAAIGRNAAFASMPGPVAGLETFTLPFGGPPDVGLAASQFNNASMALGIATDDFVFQGLIQALKEEGLLKIQAEPVLVTRSGESARLVNGGEFPIPVPQSLGTVTIEWREFGVVLESLPMVLGPTTLKQTIRAEVSERDFTTAVTLSGTTVPGLTKRTVETQAVMEFGQTLVIGGLFSTRHTAETDKIPVLGELPGIGALFRRTRYNTAETELLVMITPEFVAGMAPEQVPHGGPGLGTTVPTDRELYWDGVIEVPNYGDPCIGCGPNGGVMPPHFDSGMMPPGPSPIPINTDPNLITPPGLVPPASAQRTTRSVPNNMSTANTIPTSPPRTGGPDVQRTSQQVPAGAAPAIPNGVPTNASAAADGLFEPSRGGRERR